MIWTIENSLNCKNSMSSRIIKVGFDKVKKVDIGGNKPLVFIGGPCAIESNDHALYMAEKISKVCKKLKISWIYKSSYDKDCRSSIESFHGIGIDEGLKILSKIRKEFGVPVNTDFSVPQDAKLIGEVCDMIQVPAYLCRQTKILLAAAKTKKPVLLKKGQFMSPWNLKNSVRKIQSVGNNNILLTDRGNFFGYNMLINDFRSLPIMQSTGFPVCYDATHSIQLPTSMGNVSGGQKEFIPFLSRAAAACCIDSIFMEVHDDPNNALSDKNSVLDLKDLEKILEQTKKIHDLKIELYKKWGEDRV